MAKQKTYQVIFEGGATTFIKAYDYDVDDENVTFLGEDGRPIDKHFLRSGAVLGVIDAEDDAGGGGFTPSLSQ